MTASAMRRRQAAVDALSRWAILFVLLFLYGIAVALSDAFLEPVYVGNILRQAAPVGIAAIGATLVMILGCIDLSIGAIISFAAVFCAVLMDGKAGNLPFAIGCTLADIQDRSRGRMHVEVIGRSSEGRRMYGVVINRLRTGQEKRAWFANAES